MYQQPLLQDMSGSSAPRRKLKELPLQERPIYRLKHQGIDALSTIELLSLVLGGQDGLSIAYDLLSTFGSLRKLIGSRPEQLKQVPGIGNQQSIRLVAMMHLAQRVQLPDGDEPVTISSPADAASLLSPRMLHLQQEHLMVILLNTRNHVIGIETVYKGSLNTSVVRIGEIFKAAITANAAAIIIGHNHPSHDPSPSPEDIKVTRQIREAGELVDIKLLDHLVIGGQRYVSLKERGLGF